MTDWNTYRQTTLVSYPTGWKFNQNLAPTWDGDTTPGGENAGLDCGETCACAETFNTTGIYIPPDTWKGKILDAAGRGDSALGPSNMAQLRAAILDVAQIQTVVLTPTTTAGNASGSLLNLVWASTKDGHAVTMLRWWDHPQSGFYHWATAVGLDISTVYVFDPWTGTIITESYDQHRAMYVGASASGGGMFAYQRPRDPNL